MSPSPSSPSNPGSPVSTADITGAVGLRAPAFDSDGHTLVWLERRGADAVLLCRRRGEAAPRELTAGQRVRARVFYGGGEFTVGRGELFFVDDGERLCRQSLAGGRARPITPAFGHPAAPTVSRDGRWVVYVHSDGVTDRLAVVDADGTGWPQSLVSGADFYMQPAWHPGSRQLAWVEWDFPNMAWDGCRLRLADLRFPAGAAPVLADATTVAGGDEVAVSQPSFSPDGTQLAYASDESGFSQLWLRDLVSGQSRCLTPDDEGDVAMPGWIQGLRSIAFSGDGHRLYFTRSQAGERRVFTVELDDGRISPVEALADYACVSHLCAAPRGDEIAVVASSPVCSERIVSARGPRLTIHARATGETLLSETLSSPRAVQWAATDGSTVHGIYYPAVHGDSAAPLIVDVHGGPTSQSDVGFDPSVQYFATRGWGVLLVNYRGSTGYGRAYMTALRGNWGVYDVEDAVDGARHLVDAGVADPARLVIMGGSAGGYTVLRALTQHAGFFRAGICRYGISNLFALAKETHKFESRYNDSLLGPLPEAAACYRERSPLFAADAIRDPVALFQGTEDEVVPRAQSDAIVESLRQRDIPHEYHVYEGEGHGFRRPETKEAYTRAVEAFLSEHV